MKRFPNWPGLALIAPAALLTLLPLVVVLAAFADPQPEVWQHLRAYVLPDALANTLILLAGVGLGVLLLGVPLAWLTAVCEFPGRRWLGWALMLPLAMPAYVLAFVQAGLLDYPGPVQTFLRGMGLQVLSSFSVRSLPFAVWVLVLAFYPYVYLLARNAFATQGLRALEAAQMLGHSRWQGFWRVALPMARPWIAGGLALVLMETAADFGAVSVFNIDTLTTSIYKAWFALFNLTAATQLAGVLVLLVLALALFEHHARGRRRYGAATGGTARIRLHGWVGWLATAACVAVLLVAFIVPLGQLLLWCAQAWRTDLDARYWGFAGRSLLLALVGSALVVAMALLLVLAQRRWAARGSELLVRIATLGYAVPGTVLAVGLFVPLAGLDRILLPLLQSWGWPVEQLLRGSLITMLLALAVRFLAVGWQPLQAAMQRIGPNLADSARTLGIGEWQIIRRIQLPLLRGGVFTAALLVLVDILKEMPITLMMRPFGWDTLAVRVFEMTSEGMWERAALPSLLIILAGLVPVLLLARKEEE